MLTVQSKSFHDVLNDRNVHSTIQGMTNEELMRSIDHFVQNPGTRQDMYFLFIQCLYKYTEAGEEEYRQNLFTFQDEDVELTVCVDSFMVYLHGLYSSVKMKVFDMEDSYQLLPAWVEFGKFFSDVYSVSKELLEEINEEKYSNEST